MAPPTVDPNYLAYKDKGVIFQFLFPAIIYSILGIISILLNFSVCYITIKYRKNYSALKSNTAILLIISSFFEILQQTGQFYFLIIAASGANFVLWKKAAVFSTPAIVGFSAAIFMFISLSFDRLLAVALPIFYKNMNKRRYIYTHLVAIILFIVLIIIIIIKSAYDFPDWLINGSNFEAYELVVDDNNITSLAQVLFIPIIIFYGIVGLIIAFGKGKSDDTMKKVYRSLLLIVFINVGGYMFCILIMLYILIPITSGSQFHLLLYGIFPAALLNIASASTAPILYINSSDYKNAYKKEYYLIKRFILKLLRIKENTITTTPVEILPKNTQTYCHYEAK